MSWVNILEWNIQEFRLSRIVDILYIIFSKWFLSSYSNYFILKHERMIFDSNSLNGKFLQKYFRILLRCMLVHNVIDTSINRFVFFIWNIPTYQGYPRMNKRIRSSVLQFTSSSFLESVISSNKRRDISYSSSFSTMRNSCVTIPKITSFADGKFVENK